jgi:Retrotransposon gag protein
MVDLVAPPAVQAGRLDLSVAPFDGQKKNFCTFLQLLCLLYMANPTNYATDLAKVLFALSKITGEGFAAEWANMKAEEILGNGEAGTWVEFVEEMKRAFNDPNDRATALAEIARLKQGATMAPEFFAKFETLFRRAEMSEEADSDILVHWLELNLSRRLVGRIYGVSPMPETYVQWKALAERLDAQQHHFDGVIMQQNSMHPTLPAAN